MGPDGKDTATKGCRYPCVGNVLSGGGVTSSVVRIGIVGHVRGDNEDGGGKPFNFLKADQGQEGAEKHRWEMGDTGRQRGVDSIWNVDSGHIHWRQEGDSVAVGGSKTNLWSICMGETFQGRGEVEENVVVARGSGGSSQGQAVGGLTGGTAKE